MPAVDLRIVNREQLALNLRGKLKIALDRTLLFLGKMRKANPDKRIGMQIPVFNALVANFANAVRAVLDVADGFVPRARSNTRSFSV